MNNILLFLAGMIVLLGVGVLIGSSLHTTSIDQQYRRLAHDVQHVNARKAALDARGYPGAICGSCPLELHRGTLLIERPPPVEEYVDDD